jgi:CPA2 family monovalent cation:H+ antiporter-2
MGGVVAITSSGAMLLIEVGAVLILLALLARVAARTGFSPIPLYLLAGLIIGSIAPGDIDATTVEIGTQIAVILLLFMLGLEYAVDDVVASLRSSYVAGLADLALNFPPGLIFGLVLGWGWLPAVVLGGVTYISSSSIIAKVLDDLGRLGNSETPGVLAVLVLEDLAMAPYLPLIAVLLAGGSVMVGVAWAAGATALAVIALALARRHGPALSRRLAHPKSEVVLLSVMGLLLIAGGVAELARVSGGVVAFLVGLSISGSIAQRARELLGPLRDLFAALFFVSFGFLVDEKAIPGVLGVAVLMWLVTIASKVLTGWVAVRKSSGVPGRLRAGTALVARGEFSIVIAGLAAAAGVERRLAPLAAVYVLLTAVSAPLLTRYAGGVALRLRRPRRSAV